MAGQPDITLLRRLWWGLIGCAIAAGICLLALSLNSFVLLQKIANHFAADGQADFFTLTFYNHAVLPTRVIAGAILLMALSAWAAMDHSLRLLTALMNSISQVLRRLRSDAEIYWSERIQAGLKGVSRWEWAFLGGATLFAIACRLTQLERPMEHDEAYTVVAFASRSLWTVLSDYHLPNNHVLHTILVHFSINFFGSAPWSVRIPAFLAGVLTIPAVYFLAKRLYGRRTAILSAGLACPSAVLIHYSSVARGYSFIVLFTLVAAFFAADLVGRKNWIPWSLFILTSALGFFTIPIFLFPFGGLLTWLVFEVLAGDPLPAYGNRLAFLRYLAVATAAVILFSGILYTPILAQSGVKSLFGNSFIGSSGLNEYPSRVLENANQSWSEWTNSFPPGFSVVCLLGLILSFFFREKQKFHTHLALACAVFFLAELGLHRPGLATKLWVFLFPLCILWACTGWVGFISWCGHLFSFPKRFLLLGSGLVLLVLVAWNVARFTQLLPTLDALPGPDESTALDIQRLLQPGDIIITGSPTDAPIMYYMDIHGVPQTMYTKLKKKPFQRAFVVLYDPYQQTVSDMISSWGPDVALFDLSSTHLLANHGPNSLFLVYPYHSPSP